MKTFAELTSTNDPAWPVVLGWLKEAKVSCEVLEARELNRTNALVAIQVTTHSTLGGIVYESGGILIENGWLRLLGSGHERLKRSVSKWNFANHFIRTEKSPDSCWLLMTQRVASLQSTVVGLETTKAKCICSPQTRCSGSR